MSTSIKNRKELFHLCMVLKDQCDSHLTNVEPKDEEEKLTA